MSVRADHTVTGRCDPLPDLRHPLESVGGDGEPGGRGCAVDHVEVLAAVGRDREARDAAALHRCGHLLLPGAGELSADRVAAFCQGSADAITRVIFAAAAAGHTVHSGSALADPLVRVREIQAWTATATFTRLVQTRAGRL